jgi:hypothetical protein
MKAYRLKTTPLICPTIDFLAVYKGWGIPASTVLFPANYFIQLGNQDALGLPALLAGLQVIQESRNVESPFPVPHTQLGRIPAALKINHPLPQENSHRQNTTRMAMTPLSLSERKLIA